MSNPSRYRGVVFDLDGTLINSIPAAYTTYETFLLARQGDPSQEEFDELNGLPFPEVLQKIKDRLGLQEDLRTLSREYLANLSKVYLAKVELNAGVRELIDWLHSQGIKIALATSAPSALAVPLLDRFDLTKYFQSVVTSERVERGKPAGDPYRLALAELDLAGDMAIAVEDSANGFKSAHAAGMLCVAFQPLGLDPTAYSQGASVLVRSFAEVKELLRKSPPSAIQTASSVKYHWIELTHATETANPIAESFWEGARSRNPNLKDQLIAIASIKLSDSELEVTPRITPYRYLYAALRGIGQDLTALAVSGVVIARADAESTGENCLAFGKRAENVSQFASCWELIPSGGITAEALKQGEAGITGQLVEELREELPLEGLQIKAIVSRGAIFDRDRHVCDLAYEIQIEVPSAVLQSKELSSAEYPEMRFVRQSDLKAFLEESQNRFVPTVAPLLKLSGICPDIRT